jgi:hypothetical protein
MIFTGTYRQPSMQVEFCGSSFTPYSLHTQMSQTYAVPMFGFFVVKGKLEILAFRRVAALNKVVLPVFVFPIIPIVNKQTSLNLNALLKGNKNFPFLHATQYSGGIPPGPPGGARACVHAPVHASVSPCVFRNCRMCAINFR